MYLSSTGIFQIIKRTLKNISLKKELFLNFFEINLYHLYGNDSDEFMESKYTVSKNLISPEN